MPPDEGLLFVTVYVGNDPYTFIPVPAVNDPVAVTVITPEDVTGDPDTFIPVPAANPTLVTVPVIVLNLPFAHPLSVDAVSSKFVFAVNALAIAVSVRATVVASPAVDGNEPRIAAAVSTKLVCAVAALAMAVSVRATVVASPAVEGITERIAIAVSFRLV